MVEQRWRGFHWVKKLVGSGVEKLIGPKKDDCSTHQPFLYPRGYRTRQKLPTPVLDSFYEQLTAQDIAEIERHLTPSDIALRTQLCGNADAQDPGIKYVNLHLGVYYQVQAVLEKTGLSPVSPPEDVHSMGRGSLSAGGTTYYADLVMGALKTTGAVLHSYANVLDFGSSSGRVLRVLRSAYPNWNCYGCDPNADAIAWASRNLKGSQFSVSPLKPPLSYDAEMFDLVYAISIWSHFNEMAAISWFEEMRRIVKPQGYLLFTTHGFQAIEHYRKTKSFSEDVLQKVLYSLYERSCFFIDTFGEKGDWGVVDPGWGHAFFSPEWWLDQLCPQWQICLFIPGGVEQSQDLILLKRVL